MTIAESTLAGWTSQGAIEASARAYSSIKTAIAESTALTDKQVDVFLQGSYKNSTNTRGDSDVDVVVQSDKTFFHDLGLLTEPELSRVKSTFDPTTYTWDNFRADVLGALTAYYGRNQVTDGSKCITVANPGSSGLSADVVPAFSHRLYLPARGYVEGIAFLTQRERVRIVNFPKQHYERGVEKQSATENFYKPAVRMFKNARARAVDAGLISDDMAPSYFVECLVFNAPARCFLPPSWQEVFVQVHKSISDSGWDNLLCANSIVPLFGPGINQWKKDDAAGLWDSLARLWNA